VDGRSITIVYPRETTYDRLEEAAAELVRLKVDVIFAAQDARAAKQVTRTIPIVMAVSGDPVSLGLVASLARPGGNLTGITYLDDELVAKQMEFLKEIIPTLSRIGALVDSADPAAPQRLAQLETAARRLGLRLDAVHARAPTTFEDAFTALGRGGPGGLVILSSPDHFFQRSRLAALAIRQRLATATSSREFADARALLAYGPTPQDVSRRAAHFVDRILKGARPADLPVEQPTRFELIVNLLTAKDLGLVIPPLVLARADEVIR
jgi:putative ABC transport system substrate-binding protein